VRKRRTEADDALVDAKAEDVDADRVRGRFVRVRSGASIIGFAKASRAYGVATVDAEKELALLAVSVDHAAHLRFFTSVGWWHWDRCFERLRQRCYPDLVRHDQTVSTRRSRD
jgi:hypothetical protein